MSTSYPSESVQPALDTPMQLGESPTWVANEAALYWIDIAGCALHRLHPDSGVHVSWPLPAEPGCLAPCAGGGLIIALRCGLALFDTNDGSLASIAPAPYDTATTRFNDGRCDSGGRLWVGTIYEPRDRPQGTLYRVERGAVQDAGKPVTVSNGVAFSPDGRTLYHADTSRHAIHAYDYDPVQGTIGAGRLFKQFSDERLAPDYGGRPDGAAVDSEGAYWCAMYEGGRLLRLAPDGTVLREIALPVRCPTMMAFGGDDLRTLYITTARHNRPATELQHHPLSGYILSLRIDVPGRLDHAYVR